MAWLSFHELQAEKDRYDALVRQTPDVDVFCSSAHWVLPAQRIYAPGAQPFIWKTENAYCVFMMLHVDTDVMCAMPLEIGWGLACPLIGRTPNVTVGALAAALSRASFKPNYVMLTGLVRDTPLWRALDHRFGAQMLDGREQKCVRRVADLTGGFDAYLARRSPKFRAELRRKRRQAQKHGLTVDYVIQTDVPTFIDRIVAVESRSWKGLSEQGVNEGLPLEFYRNVIQSLSNQRALRAVFIQLDGQDIAFAFGGVEGKTFRGLQLSYVDTYRHFGAGNLAQIELIAQLISAGVTRYDLGMDMAYKAKWAGQVQETQTRLIAL